MISTFNQAIHYVYDTALITNVNAVFLHFISDYMHDMNKDGMDWDDVSFFVIEMYICCNAVGTCGYQNEILKFHNYL